MVVNTALVARIESLEAGNWALKLKLVLEDIAHNNSLVRFYTGFDSYETLLAFYDFLGPSLTYWGSKSTKGKRWTKLDPLNQLFFNFNEALSQFVWERLGDKVWTCSIFSIQVLHHMGMLTLQRNWLVAFSLTGKGHAFKERYPKTYIIVDASEIFVETLNDW